MRAGKYDQRIKVTRDDVTGRNSFGEDTKGDPIEILTLCAEVGPLEGNELTALQQRWAEARYRICVRRLPGITLQRADTIEWNGQTLDILDIQGPGTRAVEWTIIAKDHVA